MGDGAKTRQEEWTSSIEVGSKSFIENVKALLGFRAKERDVIGGSEEYQLREGAAHCNALFGAENGEIGLAPFYGTLIMNNQALIVVRPPATRFDN